MKKITLIGIVLTLWFWPCHVGAQGTLYVSNLGPPSYGTNAIASDAWIANSFHTGTNAGGYALDSINLLLSAALGNPSGLKVSIDSYGFGSVIGSLTGPSNPSTAGVYNYLASGIMLSPSTDYLVVVTATTPQATGSYQWNYNGGTLLPGDSGGWIVGSSYLSSDGLTWYGNRGASFQLAIYADAVPEPSTAAFIILGSGLLIYVRKRNK